MTAGISKKKSCHREDFTVLAEGKNKKIKNKEMEKYQGLARELKNVEYGNGDANHRRSP